MIKETVDKWVEDPIESTTHALQSDIDKSEASIEKAQTAHRSEKAKLDLLQKQLEGLQQDLTDTKAELGYTIAELEILKTNFEELQTKFNKFMCPISAMSVLSAAQTRFLEDFLFKGLNLTDQERAHYNMVRTIIEDYGDGDLPEILKDRWEQNRQNWANCLGKVFNRLSNLRCVNYHDEDRNPQMYKEMSEEEVRTMLSETELGMAMMFLVFSEQMDQVCVFQYTFVRIIRSIVHVILCLFNKIIRSYCRDLHGGPS